MDPVLLQAITSAVSTAVSTAVVEAFSRSSTSAVGDQVVSSVERGPLTTQAAAPAPINPQRRLVMNNSNQNTLGLANNLQDTENSDDDFQPAPPIRRHSLPTLYTAPSPIANNRRRGRVMLRRRTMNVQTKNVDVICLLHISGDTFPIPRITRNNHVERYRLSGKIKLNSCMSDVDIKEEISSIFWKSFHLMSPNLFTYSYLSLMVGAKRLQRPNVSCSYKWGGVEVMGLCTRSKLYIMSSNEMSMIEVMFPII